MPRFVTKLLRHYGFIDIVIKSYKIISTKKMKKRKLSFLISIIVIPYVVLIVLSPVLFILPLFISDEYSGFEYDHSYYLTEDLEINIDVLRGNKVDASLSQSSYTLLYTIPADQENDCPEYEAGHDIWHEQRHERITVDPGDKIICYLATEDFENFFPYEYEIGSTNQDTVQEEIESIFTAGLIIFILAMITYALILVPIIYMVYWLVQTKAELKARGADEIPSSWLIIVPVANIYYIYKYAEGAEKVTKGKVSLILVLIIFIMAVPSIIMPICQSQYNKID